VFACAGMLALVYVAYLVRSHLPHASSWHKSRTYTVIGGVGLVAHKARKKAATQGDRKAASKAADRVKCRVAEDERVKVCKKAKAERQQEKPLLSRGQDSSCEEEPVTMRRSSSATNGTAEGGRKAMLNSVSLNRDERGKRREASSMSGGCGGGMKSAPEDEESDEQVAAERAALARYSKSSRHKSTSSSTCTSSKQPAKEAVKKPESKLGAIKFGSRSKKSGPHPTL